MPSELLPFVDMAASAANNKGNFINSVLGTVASNTIANNQYKRQRADALSDWNMQNEYNSPKAQMQRLKDAGLNPHLVYGNGATAMSSSQPRQSEMKAVHAEAANANTSGSVMGFYDAQVKQAQSNNLQQQFDIMEQEKQLKAAQVVATLLGIDMKNFEFGVKRELRETTIEAAKAQLHKIYADTERTEAATQFTLDENQRQALMNEKDLRIATIKATQMLLENNRIKASTSQIEQAISNMKLDGRIKEAQVKLWDKGINPSWPAYTQILLTIAEAIAKHFLPEGKEGRKSRLDAIKKTPLDELMAY